MHHAVFALIVALSLNFFHGSALAQESAEVEKQPITPITKWRAEESALIENLSDNDKQLYFILRNKQGVIRAIRVVKSDIGGAVQECGQKNPEIQDEMSTRFKGWKNSVDPLLKTADKYLKQEINEQGFVSKKDFKRVVKLNDEAFDYQESLADKNYVTTLEACKDLIKSMDNTEEDMLRLMQDVLLPSSVIKERG